MKADQIRLNMSSSFSRLYDSISTIKTQNILNQRYGRQSKLNVKYSIDGKQSIAEQRNDSAKLRNNLWCFWSEVVNASQCKHPVQC